MGFVLRNCHFARTSPPGPSILSAGISVSNAGHLPGGRWPPTPARGSGEARRMGGRDTQGAQPDRTTALRLAWGSLRQGRVARVERPPCPPKSCADAVEEKTRETVPRGGHARARDGLSGRPSVWLGDFHGPGLEDLVGVLLAMTPRACPPTPTPLP